MSCRTGKVRYHNERVAKLALTDSLIKQAFNERTRRREKRAYHCPICKGWHLTSAPLDPGKGAA